MVLRPLARATVAGAPKVVRLLGRRATPGQVGYLGAPSALTSLGPGDPAPTSWSASWQSNGTLRVNAADVVIDGYRILGGLDIYGANPTVRGCHVTSGGQASFGIAARAGVGSIRHCTVDRVAPAPGTQVEPLGAVAHLNNGVLAVTDCDLSGHNDGVKAGGPTMIRRCYIHGNYFDPTGTAHCDGVQQWNSGSGFSLFDSWIDITAPGGAWNDSGAHYNGCLALGASNSYPRISNNYFAGGPFPVRFEADCNQIVFERNDFGPPGDGFAGYFTRGSGVTFAAWTLNRRHDGSVLPAPV